MDCTDSIVPEERIQAQWDNSHGDSTCQCFAASSSGLKSWGSQARSNRFEVLRRAVRREQAVGSARLKAAAGDVEVAECVCLHLVEDPEG